MEQFTLGANYYLEEKLDKGISVTCKEVYSSIGQYDKHVRKRYGAFSKWVVENVKLHNEKIKFAEIQGYKVKLRDAILELQRSNKRISNKNLSEITNISESYLSYNKELKTFIDNYKRIGIIKI